MKPSDPPPLAGAWSVVALLWFAACFNYLARIMVTTMHSSILESFPITEAQFGLLTSVFLWVYGSFGPFSGFLADRFRRSRVIVLSLFAWSLVTWLTGFAKTFHEFLAMRALMGISEASYIPAAQALISDYHRGRTRALAVGLHMTGVFTGAALGGLGGWLADLVSWHFAFQLVGAGGAAYSLALLFTLRDAPREVGPEGPETEAAPKAHFGQALASLFGRGSFVLLFVFVAGMGAVAWTVLGWAPTYLKEHFHIGQGEAGFSATSYLNIAGVLGLLVSGAWAGRWSRRNIRASIYVVAIGLCIAAPGVLLSARASLLALSVFGLTLYGFGVEFSDSNVTPIICQVVDPRYRATALGVLNLSVAVVGGLAIYATGVLRDKRLDTGMILTVAAGAQLLCIVPLLLVNMRPPVISKQS
jgi:MFS family permease